MKKGIISLCAVALITIGIWWYIPVLGSRTPFWILITQLIGALAIAGFMCTFLMSTRIRVLDHLFDGLDKTYVVHKWVGIISTALAFAHLIVLVVYRISNQSSQIVKNTWGFPSLILFVVLILAALIAKKMKYETWKIIHKFMIIPFAIGVYHYYYASRSPFTVTPFNILMHILNAVGILCAIYIVFLYEGVGFPYKYKITSVKNLAEGAIEITGQAIGKHIKYKPGQFAFMKIPAGDSKMTSRPFTISNAPEDGIIQFSIKDLGDDTARLLKTVKVGDEFAISPAHGMFDYTKGKKNQIWIAAGIGLAPFRCFYQTDIPDNYSIELFYSYRGAEGVYLDEVQNLNKPNVRVHLTDTKQQGRFTAEKIIESIDTKDVTSVYFCGPKVMRDSLKKSFRKNNIPVHFHYDEFNFGR